jgi:hypothetical protein
LGGRVHQHTQGEGILRLSLPDKDGASGHRTKENLMKHLKMLGLAAVAATVLMAFIGAGSASANTVICLTEETPCGSNWDLAAGATVDAHLEGTAIFETTGGAVLDTCSAGTAQGTNTTTTTPTVSVEASGLTWSGCTRTIDTLSGGSVQIHANGDAAHTGTITARGLTWTINTVFGSCTFGWGNEYVTLGTVTSSTPTATPTIHINAVIPKESGPCPDIRWTAAYKATTPHSATIIP